MELSEYTSLDATELAGRIKAGEVTREEVFEIARKAIEAVNPELNAVANGPFEEPLDYDRDGAFSGVPFVIKDLVLHASGVPNRAGTRLSGDGVTYDDDTHLMARFKQAGLATAAVTTTPEYGFNANTEALIYGSTCNPWDTSRSPGGSSGGSAALVAAGAVPVGHANDGGGSIRIPAACSGLVGLKPSRGRTPLGPDLGDALSGLAIEFAVTRSVRDAAALLDEVAGPMPGDRFIIAPPARAYAAEVGADPGKLRIGLQTAPASNAEIDPEVVAAVETVGQQLADLGHEVELARPEFDWETFLDATVVVWCAFLAESVAAMEQMTGRKAGPDNTERTSWSCIERGRSYSPLDLGAAAAIFNQISRGVGEFFTGYDLLVTPTINTPPYPLGFLDADADMNAEEWTRHIFSACSFTPLFNTTGTPAISLPLAQSSAGLPIGVQLAGDMCREDVLIRVAAQLEQAMPWTDRRPKVHAAAAG